MMMMIKKTSTLSINLAKICNDSTNGIFCENSDEQTQNDNIGKDSKKTLYLTVFTSGCFVFVIIIVIKIIMIIIIISKRRISSLLSNYQIVQYYCRNELTMKILCES